MVEVVDDGDGGADPRGSGLRGLRDRVEALDGSLTVESAPGRGTMLRAGASMRVILADDAVVIREGVARLLADEGIEVVAQVGDADALRQAVRDHPVDVVVTDIRMPPDFADDGLRAAEEIRAEHPSRGLVLSQYVDVAYAVRLTQEQARASGTCSRTASSRCRP